MNNEDLLFPYISSCNIACGGHAGDVKSMRSVIQLAKEHGVRIGAHPSFPDRENFGRVAMSMSSDELRSSLVAQLTAFTRIAAECRAEVHHVKAHGALYNLAAKDQEVAKVFLSAVGELKKVPIYAPIGSEMALLGKQFEVPVIYEAFADRNYNEDLSLVSRKHTEALILDPDQMLIHVFEIVRSSRVKTITGKYKHIKADTLCIHSDSDNSQNLVKSLYDNLIREGIQISALQ